MKGESFKTPPQQRHICCQKFPSAPLKQFKTQFNSKQLNKQDLWESGRRDLLGISAESVFLLCVVCCRLMVSFLLFIQRVSVDVVGESLTYQKIRSIKYLPVYEWIRGVGWLVHCCGYCMAGGGGVHRYRLKFNPIDVYQTIKKCIHKTEIKY